MKVRLMKKCQEWKKEVEFYFVISILLKFLEKTELEKPPSHLAQRGINKTFPGVKALTSVDFEISKGEVVALIGENGAGKSTLMNILGGVHQPDSGEIKVNDKIVTIKSVSQADSLGIGFVHQELNICIEPFGCGC